MPFRRLKIPDNDLVETPAPEPLLILEGLRFGLPPQRRRGILANAVGV